MLVHGINISTAAAGRLARRLQASGPPDPSSGFSAPAAETLKQAGELRFAGAVAEQTELPFFADITPLLDPETARRCATGLMARHLFIPLRLEGDELLTAVANPWGAEARGFLETRFPGAARFATVLTTAAGVLRAVESLADGAEDAAEALRRQAGRVEEEDAGHGDAAAGTGVYLPRDFDLDAEYADSPARETLRKLLRGAIAAKASDVHIKCERSERPEGVVYYQYRVDGSLREPVEIPAALRDRLDAVVLTIQGRPPEERVREAGISGRFTCRLSGRAVDVRYERHHSYRGFHVTLRLLDRTAGQVSRVGEGTLAFDDLTVFELRRALAVPSGIIVMSGPTGSGKSTTLNALLRMMAAEQPELNYLTLENPVEDEIPGVIHCNLRREEDFKPMIKSFMRSDPDVIFMGEVRDPASAELAVEAAITGHRVLTTIHTPGAAQIIERFRQLGVEGWKIGQTLRAACAQRLVRLLCPACREEARPRESDRRMFNLTPEVMEAPLFRRRRGGCPDCGHFGYAGRAAILEILPVPAEFGDQISSGLLSGYLLETEIRRLFPDLPSLRSAGLRLLLDGKTDLEALASQVDLTRTDRMPD